VAGLDDIDDWTQFAQLEPEFFEPTGQCQPDIGFASTVTPAGHHGSYELSTSGQYGAVCQVE